MAIASIDTTRKCILMHANYPLLDICRLNRAVHGDCLYRYNVDKIILMYADYPSYDNAACAGSVISTACHPPSRFEESLTSTLPSMVGRDQEAAPKPDGRTQSNTTSILLASTPSMPPSWSMTDPSGRPLFADCQRSNPSMALKSR